MCTLVLAMGGCGGPREDAIRLGIPSAPITLDPRFATDAASYRVTRLLYASLVDFDDGFRFVPALATWEQPTPTTYVFSLGAQQRRFHDGSRLTAADVKATYDSVLNAAVGSPHRGSLENIASITTPDADTVVFHLQRADPLFPGRLVIGILPAARLAAGHPFNVEPVGSGPLRMQAWPEPGRLLLARADGTRMEINQVSDFTVRALKLVRGELDVIQGDLPQEIVTWLAAKPNLRVLRKPGNTFAYLGFNLRDRVTGDRRVREAVSAALDRDAIIRYLLQTSARPAGGLMAPDHWAGIDAAGAVRHDLQRARTLMRQLGFGPERLLKLTYKTSNNASRVRIATVIQHQLRQAYMDVDVRTHEWGTFYGDVKSGRFQMYSLAWVGLKLPDIFRYAFHSASLPPQGANRGRLSDARVDALIEAAESAGSLEVQAPLYRELQQRLLEVLPYAPLWYEDHVAVVRQGVSYRIQGDGTYDGLREAGRIAP